MMNNRINKVIALLCCIGPFVALSSCGESKSERMERVLREDRIQREEATRRAQQREFENRVGESIIRAIIE